MNIDPNGLPLPGRELDAWIAIEIMGWHRAGSELIEWHDSQGHFMGYVLTFEPSTTHAFFQVMEADSDALYMTHDYGTKLLVKRWDTSKRIPDCGIGHWSCQSVWVSWADYPSREAAYAHAVCCCAWKAAQ